MKARIKATGEVVDLCYKTQHEPVHKEATLVNGRAFAEFFTENKLNNDEHWQDVRERAAIAAMQGVMNFFGSIDYNRDTIAKLAVEQADALIEQLKKKEQ